jgi:pyrimidine operon attenuation protein / uracil phosphoribosyltransferase
MGIKYLRKVMGIKGMDLSLTRISAEILEHHPDLSDIVLIGIHRRGVPLARFLQEKIETASGVNIPLGRLDITFYRDDLSMVASQPVVGTSHLDFDITGKVVLLVDDVLNTGRTTRAALESVMDYGRPRRVELAVLVDRGHRELPIQADYIGRSVETAEEELIEVRVNSVDGEEGVFLTTRKLLQAPESETSL